MDNYNNMYGSYNADSIGVSDNVERHRRAPAQYLGASNCDGIWNQFTEFFDNARDEVIECYNIAQEIVNEHCKRNSIEPFIVPPLQIDVTIDEDDRVTISDMGRGVPCGLHKLTGEPAIFSIYENDSAGAKGTFSAGGYTTEGTSGMHGAGAAVSKSCTEFFNVTVKEGNSGNEYYVQYRKGYRNTELGENGLFLKGQIGLHKYPQLAELGFKDTGTTVEYKYDSEVLEASMGGVACEAYNEEKMLKRIKMSMLGITNKNCIQINFNFKGHLTVITPMSMTPESFLGVEPGSPYLRYIELDKMYGTENDKSRYRGTLYIKFNEGSYGFKCKTIVNKLEQHYTQHDNIIEKAFNNAFREVLKEWVDDNQKKGYRMPTGHIFKPAEKFECLFVMNLPIAEFGGQTKDRLESTAYIPYLSSQLTNTLKASAYDFDVCMDYFKQEIIEETKRLKDAEKQAEKLKQKKEQSQREKDEDAKVKELSNNILARLEEEEKNGAKYKLDFKQPIKIHYDKCLVCFFEGDSANMVVNKALKQGLQIVSVVTTGKLPNIHKNRNKILTDRRIRQLRTRIFEKNFAYYVIFVDPDPDGTHIRTQLLRIIEEYRPDMLNEGRVFICRAPYGEVMVYDKPIKLKTALEGERTLAPGTNFVLSYEEMEQAIQKGASKVRSFRGALDVVTKCQHILPFEQLITNPLYLVKLKPPSSAQIEMLHDVLSEKSVLRGKVTRQMYTKRQMYSKYIAKQSTKHKLKLKVRDMSSPVICKVSTTPTVQDCYQYRIPEI